MTTFDAPAQAGTTPIPPASPVRVSAPSARAGGRSRSRRVPLAALLLAAAAGFVASPAGAHHGWAWADEAQSELSGTVQQVDMAPPHPWIDVKAADGATWRVDLGNPTQTERSGFAAGSARPGDPIVVVGNRDRDRSRARMKAVQITVAGKPYVMYPERVEKR